MGKNFTTKDDDDKETGDFLSQDAVGNEKHFLIRVPHYGESTFQKKGDAKNPKGKEAKLDLTSFLRMGKFDIDDETEQSLELLGAIHQAGGPGDPRRPASEAWDGTNWLSGAPPFLPKAPDKAGNKDVFFLDDVRTHDVDLDPSILTKADTTVRGHGLTQAQRHKESRELYARGGWRDHSDGNRISTTYGDKVEVVRGNYKMIVLGRQDDPGEGMGWETSGDHVVDYAPGTMPGAGYWLEFVPDYQFTATKDKKKTGVWLLVNTTENVYEYARYAGNFREERWGDVLETYVGSENPPDGKVGTDDIKGTHGHEPPVRLADRNYDLPKYVNPHNPTNTERSTPEWQYDNKDMIRSNPHIIEKTWAKRVDSHTGSQVCPIPEGIHEKTYAVDTNSYTSVSGTATEETRVGTQDSKTYASVIKEYTEISNRVESNTIVASSFSSTVAGTIIEQTTAGLHAEMHVGPHLSLEVGAAAEIFLGGKFGFQAAAGVEINTQGVAEITLPKKAEINVEKMEIALNRKITALGQETAALKIATKALLKDDKALAHNLVALMVRIGA